jgi:predicted permease
VRRQSVSQEIDAEIASHIAYATDELIAQGLSPAEARRRALLEFGGVQQTREWVLRERALHWWYDAVRDVRLALRRLRKEPASNAAIVLVIAIGIACVTSVFSLMNAVWIRPLAYSEPAQLVQLHGIAPTRVQYDELPAGVVVEARQRAHDVATFATFDERQTPARIGDTVAEIHRSRIDEATLRVLRVAPTMGRAPTEAEFRAQSAVALISDSIWRIDFASRDDLDEAQIELGGVAHRVIGVMPKRFYFHTRAVVWTPLAAADDEDAFIQVVARLKPGMTRDSLAKRLQQASAGEQGAESTRWRVVPSDLHDRGQRPAGYSIAAVAMLVTAIVLVVACANVMNILLARSASRRREMAVEAALGASSFRLMRQLLVECWVLACAAGLLGLALSQVGLELMLRAIPRRGFPGWIDFGLDWRVMSFALATALLTMLVFGLLPAREASRVDPMRAIQDGDSLGVTSRNNRRWSARLISVQLALSLVLVITSGLLVASYRSMLAVEPAYPGERLMEFIPMLDERRMGDLSHQHAHGVALAAELRGDPMFAAVSTHSDVRWLSRESDTTRYLVDYTIRLLAPHDTTRLLWRASGMWPQLLVTDATFFALRRRRLVQGRNFADSDTVRANVSMIVSENIAKAVWGDSSAIGRQVRLGTSGPVAQIIGVVEDVPRLRFAGGRVSRVADPQFFFTYGQAEPSNTYLTVESRSAVSTTERSAVRDHSAALDPAMRLPELRTMEEQATISLLPLRLFATVLTVVASFTLGIAAVGLFGLVHFATLQRRREIGIRLALGAAPRRLERWLLFDALRTTRTGLIAGALATMVLLGLMQSRVPISASVLISASAVTGAVLMAVVVIACWLPVRKAAQMDPNDVLRGA